MFRTPILQKRASSRLALAVVLASAMAALIVQPVFAGAPGLQIEDFYGDDGSQVLSDDGMPFAHAAVFRFYDRPQADGICWDVMTVNLTPGVWYDIWLEGSNDGTDEGAFAWWLGKAKATGQGDLDKAGFVFTGQPPGPNSGSFTNARAAFYLVIRTSSGEWLRLPFTRNGDAFTEPEMELSA